MSTATVPQPVDRDTGPGAAPAVLVVAGVLAIGGGIALYLVRNNYLTQLDAQCSAGEMARCPASAEASYNSAVLFNALSITAFGVGGVATLIGSAWWLLAPRSRVEVHPQPTLGGMMLHVSTRF